MKIIAIFEKMQVYDKSLGKGCNTSCRTSI